VDLPADLGPVVLFVQSFVREPFVQICENPEQESSYDQSCKSIGMTNKEKRKFHEP
jgi:hypothetical protein